MKTMTGHGEFKGKPTVSRSIGLVLLATALILLVPLLAMQFSDEMAWSLFDFAGAGALLIGAGLSYVMVMRTVGNARTRIMVGVALAAALLLVWVELAVGVFGTPFAGS